MPSSSYTNPILVAPTSVSWVPTNDTEGGRWEVTFPTTGFSGFFAQAGIANPLPVNLVSFSGKTVNNTNILTWKTANELAFEGFEVQKSVDGKAFEKIGYVKGNNAEVYQFSENRILPLNQNLFYYRLKMNDLNGKYTYSKVISIKNKEVKLVVGDVYPNPVYNNDAYINIKSKENGSFTFTIYDLTGKVIDIQKMNLIKGENKLQIDLSNLNIGINFLKIESQKEQYFRKLMK